MNHGMPPPATPRSVRQPVGMPTSDASKTFRPLAAAVATDPSASATRTIKASANRTLRNMASPLPERWNTGVGEYERRAASGSRNRRRRALIQRQDGRSAALEVALALPVVDDRVVDLLLHPSRVEVV